MTEFVGKAFPAKIVRTSGTTLFHVAANELGTAQEWERVASLNDIVDPFIDAEVELKIPQATTNTRGVVLGGR